MAEIPDMHIRVTVETPTQEEVAHAELERWWRQVSEADLDLAFGKALEYGSFDLDMMGHILRKLTGREIAGVESVEMAIGFYLAGKLARMLSAYERGARPSNDTLRDLTIYAMMIRRLRAEGRWP